MSDEKSTDNGPEQGRSADGRFAPGNQLGTPWGPDNPPFKSAGRPRKEAWIRELEKRLEDTPDLRRAMADVLIKLALKGSETAKLKALAMIADRVDGPVTQRVEDMTDYRNEPRRIIIVGSSSTPPPLPESCLERERQRQAAEDQAQVKGRADP